jgi:hypothetical protein
VVNARDIAGDGSSRVVMKCVVVFRIPFTIGHFLALNRDLQK